MNVFELLFFLGLLALIGVASQALESASGIGWWVFASAFGLLIAVGLRVLSKRLRARRMGRSISKSTPKDD